MPYNDVRSRTFAKRDTCTRRMLQVSLLIIIITIPNLHLIFVLFFISLDYHTNLFLTMQNVAYTMFALCCIGAVIGAAVDTNTEHERMQM